MRRGPRPAKTKVTPRQPVDRQSAKNRGPTRLELENRLAETVKQQAATAEILGVISRSPTDVQPVFDTIAANAVNLCDAVFGSVFLFDGELVTLAALFDTLEERERTAYRSLFPMLKGDDLVGVIMIYRLEVRPFSPKQISLVETFADQAVIAIEKVRLFNELQACTHDLTRSVDELHALGEVSRAVSSTLNLETVLNTVVVRAVEISATYGGVIYEYDETKQAFDRIRTAHRLDDELGEVIRATPMRLGEGVSGTAAALRSPVQVSDVLDEQAYGVARIRAVFERHGFRSLLAVPLLFEDRILGVLTVWRQEPGTFPPKIVNLLQTFATQSVLAIQNARLFSEIADKSRQLESASRHKSEFLANMSHELRTP